MGDTGLARAMQERMQQGDLEGTRNTWELLREDAALPFATKMEVLRACADALGLDMQAEKRACTNALRRSLK